MKTRLVVAVVAGVLIVASSSGRATTVFLEDFNSPTGHNQNNAQVTTGLPVAFGGDYSNWMKSGSGTAHLVDRGGADSWALMLFQGPELNVLTSTAIPAGNIAGQHYAIHFDLAAAVYGNPDQATDFGVPAHSDGVYVEVLDATNTVIAGQLFKPGAFESQAGPGALPFGKATMTYIGTGAGAGEVSLRLSASNSNQGRFGGSVDNLTINSVLFSENFNEPTGIYNQPQYITELPVAYNGNLTNWIESGFNAIHLVERTPGAAFSNQAAMFFNGVSSNVLTSVPIAGGNSLNQQYEVSFELAPGSYNQLAQATTAVDGMVIQLLDSNNQIVASSSLTDFLPGVFADSASLGHLEFVPVSFNYTGTGSGDGSISIRLMSNAEGTSKFGGAIDNLVLSTVPEPGASVLCVCGVLGLARVGRRLRRC